MTIHDRYAPVIIPKDKLQHGHYYAGICRNARIARWDATRTLFVHWREKFGRTFTEEIDYFTPEGQYDEFVPVIDLGPEVPAPIPLGDHHLPTPFDH